MPKPIYLFIGDPLLTEDKVKALSSQISEKISGQIQEHKYRFPDLSLDRVISDARALPFLTQAQIFYLRGAELIKEKKFESLELYLEKPADNSFLIFEGSGVDRRSAFVKLVEKYGEVVVIEDAQGKIEGARIVKAKLQNLGKTIAPQALQRLLEQMGDVPMALESIVDQLISYADKENEISLAMVEKFEENWQEVDVFDLTNAISAMQTGKSLQVMRQLVEGPGDLIQLLGLLHWQIKRYWRVKVMLEEGISEKEAFRKCRISPKQASFFSRQLKQFSREKLETAVEGLFQMDWKSKTGRVDANLEIEKWLIEITSEPNLK